MVETEPSSHTTEIFDHPNPEKAEENFLKCNFMKIMVTFKEQMKNSITEIGEKRNKIWQK